MSKWRKRARQVIDEVIAEHFADTREQIMDAIDRAYPFGPRQYHPYKMWLAERALTKERLFSSGDPITRSCPACGAKPGKPCLSIESKASALQTELVGVIYRNETSMHEARKRTANDKREGEG